MQQFLIGVAVIAVIVGWVWLRMKISRGINRGVSKVLYKNTNARGLDEVWTELTFTAPGSPQEVQAALVSALALPTEVPPVIGKLYLAAQSERGIVVRRGSKLGTEWTGQAVLTPADGGGTTGVWTVTHWTLRDGVIQSDGVIKDMAGMRQSIDAAVTRIGGTCATRVLPELERVKR